MSNPLPTLTVREWIDLGTVKFEEAGLWFGHGTDNARDEAAELVFFAAGLRHEDADSGYNQLVSAEQAARINELFETRTRQRVPAAYLTHRMWFAGHEFYVDERALVPRSPIAELIESRFEPWISSHRIRKVLDIGTGSGCIAIAAALALPDVQVDASDISTDALDVAKINIARFGLEERVSAVQSDVFEGLGSAHYDVIVSNPPYVGDEEMAQLPDEYAREPRLALHSGSDGLDVTRRILRGARERLTQGGILIVEVGNSEVALEEAFPDVPFMWLEFERGGGGVFVLTAEELEAYFQESD
jgi:ribosomal protein L3 glutamine methyltransferase